MFTGYNLYFKCHYNMAFIFDIPLSTTHTYVSIKSLKFVICSVVFYLRDQLSCDAEMARILSPVHKTVHHRSMIDRDSVECKKHLYYI